jgi:hypothetical protein
MSPRTRRGTGNFDETSTCLKEAVKADTLAVFKALDDLQLISRLTCLFQKHLLF